MPVSLPYATIQFLLELATKIIKCNINVVIKNNKILDEVWYNYSTFEIIHYMVIPIANLLSNTSSSISKAEGNSASTIWATGVEHASGLG